MPFLVAVKDVRPRAVRVNITLPADVLEEINKAADLEKTTRSGFLAEAAMERIQKAD